MSGPGSTLLPASIGGAARDTIAWLEDTVSGLSAGQWALLVIAAGALSWVVANIRALTRLGPIDVQPLESDGGSAKVKGLTARFREALARTGLMPPPAVPAGTPQVNLLAAVEASNISQAAWVAKLIDMIPRPRPHEYRITGTLQDPPDCGISVWVRPAREGQPIVDTYDGGDYEKAIDRAATAIYLHISNHAVDAFPLWARWRDATALESYRDGCHERTSGDLDEAIGKLLDACALERFNKLPDLQLANVYEQQAQLYDGLAAAVVQALALRRYLQILEDADTIVEAHYRASIVASALATRAEPLNAAQRTPVVQALGMEGVNAPADLVPALRSLAELENRTVLQLLAPLYTALNEHRVRTQFEPQAHERRQMRHSVAISKHCVHARAALDDPSPERDRELRRREIAVHWGHLLLGWGSLNWQARYNAACFDALLLERRKRKQKQKPEGTNA